MKLAISNIAWDTEQDRDMYEYLAETGIQGVEIAPTRIFPLDPYAQLKEAEQYSKELFQNYGLTIPSIQSIWFGRNENIFETKEEREILFSYTKKAIHFAEALGSNNLVFGCPRNRNQRLLDRKEENRKIAAEFFTKIGEYARMHHTVLAMEANPILYHTNFLNETAEVISFVSELKESGLRVNLDTGTMLQNQEELSVLYEKVNWIHHVHLSEPNLNRIEPRPLHSQMTAFLKESQYEGYLSIEMKKQDTIQQVKEIVAYVLRV